MTLTIPEIKNALDEGTTKTVTAILTRPEGNEVRVRSDGPDLEAKALNAEAEPNKRFARSLTPLSDQFRSAYLFKKLITLQAVSQVEDVLTPPGKNTLG